MMSKSADKTPLLKEYKQTHDVGGGILTFKEMAAIIRNNPNSAHQMRAFIKELPEETRKQIIDDFSCYSSSTKVSNGNWAVFEFMCNVLKDSNYKPKNTEQMHNDGCVIS